MARQVWPNIVNRDVAQPSRVQLTRAEGVTDVNVYDVVPIPGTIKAEGTKINETLFDQMEQYIKEYDIPIHTTTGTGAAYAVSVPVWSNLTQTELDGHILCIIPNVVSTTVSPTLNMNGLGAKPIYAPGGSSTSDRGNLPIASYLTANVPVYLIYNKSGDCWITMNAATTPVATNTTVGTVKPDTSTVTIDSTGQLSVPTATAATKGLVKPDGNTIGIDTDGTIKANIATTSAVGVTKPDGETITISSDGTLTSNAKDEIAAQHERDQLEFANALIGNKSGMLVNVDDAWGVKALKAGVDGKSVQDGTPTPDAPVEVDVVDSPVSVQAVGKNLLDLSPQNIDGQQHSTYLGDGWWRMEVSNGEYANLFALAKAKIKPSTKYYAVVELKNSDGEYIAIMSSTSSTQCQFEDRSVRAVPNTVSVHEILSVNADLMTSAVYSMRAYVGGAVGVSRLVELRVSIFPTREEAVGFAYEPYNGQTLSITLPSDHNYLASLPDGTRDELVLRSDGVAVLTERVGKVVFDGSADEGWGGGRNGAGKIRFYTSFPLLAQETDVDGIEPLICDTFKTVTAKQTWNGTAQGIAMQGVQTADRVFLLCVESIQTVAALRTWLAANPVTVYYKLATPATMYSADNGTTWSTTDPAAGNSAIQLYKGTNNVWCTDALSPNTNLEYVQDTNAVIKKLSAAIVAAGSIGV